MRSPAIRRMTYGRAAIQPERVLVRPAARTLAPVRSRIRAAGVPDHLRCVVRPSAATPRWSRTGPHITAPHRVTFDWSVEAAPMITATWLSNVVRRTPRSHHVVIMSIGFVRFQLSINAANPFKPVSEGPNGRSCAKPPQSLLCWRLPCNSPERHSFMARCSPTGADGPN